MNSELAPSASGFRTGTTMIPAVEAKIPLYEVLPLAGAEICYVGDNWRHLIELEEIVPESPACSHSEGGATSAPLLLVRSPVRFASTEELIHSCKEVRSGWRSRYASGKNPFEGNWMTIYGIRVRAVLVNNVAVQVDSGK